MWILNKSLTLHCMLLIDQICTASIKYIIKTNDSISYFDQPIKILQKYVSTDSTGAFKAS